MQNVMGEIAVITAQALQRIYGEACTTDVTVETPPDIAMGDFAVPCFPFARQYKTSPAVIAQAVAAQLQADGMLGTWEAAGPYVNVRVQSQILFGAAIQPLQPLASTGRQVMVEYLSPNTNKPLHVGHVRNGVTGMSVASLLAFAGDDVVRTEVVNDRGVHICKSMLAWQRWGNGATPETTGQKGDHFVGDYYVRFAQELENDPTLADAAQAMLKQWEDGDEDVRALWRMMNAWVEDGFRTTFADYGFVFDRDYHESDFYHNGKQIVEEGVARGVFMREASGAVVFPLDAETFGVQQDGSAKKATLLRADGTALYATQDLALAGQKSADYPSLDASVYVVGEEQEYYFTTLFAIFGAMGFPWATQCYHLSYAMVNLPTGKMKSREGTVVDADDLLVHVTKTVAQDLRVRHGDALADAEVARRARVMALAAIKFFLIKSNPKTPITFDIALSVAMEGATGPYIQYAYTRARSVMRKAQQQERVADASDLSGLGGGDVERALAQQLITLPATIVRAAYAYDPSLVARAAYQLAQTFHSYYNDTPILTDDQVVTAQRLALVAAVADALRETLALLGIDVLEEM